MKFIYAFCLLLLFPSLLLSQNSIKATFSPAEDYRWAILYENSPLGNIYVAQGKIEDGKLEFTLDASKKEGVYKLVYAAPQDEFNFDIIYNGKENIELSFAKETGVIFQQSSGNLLLNSYLSNMANIGKEIEDFYLQNRTDSQEATSLFKRQLALQNQFEEESKNSLANHFIRANKPYIPASYENKETYLNNLTTNYFNHVDFKDTVLQSSNFLLERSLAYIAGVSHKGMDKEASNNTNINTVANLISTTDPYFQKYFLDKLWKKLVNYDLKDSANYLAATHLIPLAEELKDSNLVIKLSQFKNLSIGNVAPEIAWNTEKNGVQQQHQLSDLAISENYILIFWSSSCSHCLEQLPKLKSLVQTLDNTKFKVIAIGLEDNEIKWENEILKYPEFTHIIKLGKWENEVVKTYGLTSTPTYFVLDRDKKFIAKPENLEELKDFLEK